MPRGVVAVVVLVWVLSTAGPFPAEAQPVTPDEVLAGTLLGATSEPRTAIKSSEVLALSDEMREFLKVHVNRGATDVFKLQQLIDAVMGTKTFGLEYDENTRTAAETFHLQLGNCLSFTTMFVTLARGAGLKADFQEVDIPPDWSTRKDIFVLNRHVNVTLYLGAAGTHVVDFNIGDFQSTFKVNQISDRRAVAHFFNNIGVERMQDGDTVEAVAYFRQAIVESDGDFSPAWTNLGTLYRKHGHFRYAEAAYLQALRVDKQDAVAMSNLVALYGKMGDLDKSRIYQKRVDEHRMQNPYLRYSLARDAFFNHDYDTAIEHLKVAIRKDKNEDKFYFLLGLSHLMMGDEKVARRWTSKAEKLAETDEQKYRYSTKIEALISASRNLR
jgi:Flp pilus assembly protein TadD